MLTPQEVSSRSFSKSMMGGYNMAMVDEFLDELTDDYTALYEGKTLDQLKTLLPLEKAIAVDQINRMNPVELTPDMLLYDCGRGNSRRDIPESGEEYEDRKVYGKK